MFISGVGEDAAEGEVAEYYAGQRAAWGFLPNYAPAFSTRPEVARAWNALNLAVRGGMDRRRFEIATIAAARARRSTYCTAAHSAFLRDVCGDEAAMAAIAEHPDGAAPLGAGPSGATVRRQGRRRRGRRRPGRTWTRCAPPA